MKKSSHSPAASKTRAMLEISASFLVTTRQQRKKALNILIQLLHIVLSAEKRFIADLHINQLGSSQHDVADQAVEALHEAIDILEDVYC